LRDPSLDLPLHGVDLPIQLELALEEPRLELLEIANDVRQPEQVMDDAEHPPEHRHAARRPQRESERKPADRHARRSTLGREPHPAKHFDLRLASLTQRFEKRGKPARIGFTA
jgi:hypothetical protein